MNIQIKQRDDHAKPQGTQRKNENSIGKIVVDSAINIHKELGPGLLESVYEVILAFFAPLREKIKNITCHID